MAQWGAVGLDQAQAPWVPGRPRARLVAVPARLTGAPAAVGDVHPMLEAGHRAWCCAGSRAGASDGGRGCRPRWMRILSIAGRWRMAAKLLSREAAAGCDRRFMAETGAGECQLTGVIKFHDGCPASRSHWRPARRDPSARLPQPWVRRRSAAARAGCLEPSAASDGTPAVPGRAKVLGVAKQTLHHWIRAKRSARLTGSCARLVNPTRNEEAQLRAEPAARRRAHIGRRTSQRRKGQRGSRPCALTDGAVNCLCHWSAAPAYAGCRPTPRRAPSPPSGPRLEPWRRRANDHRADAGAGGDREDTYSTKAGFLKAAPCADARVGAASGGLACPRPLARRHASDRCKLQRSSVRIVNCWSTADRSIRSRRSGTTGDPAWA